MSSFADKYKKKNNIIDIKKKEGGSDLLANLAKKKESFVQQQQNKTNIFLVRSKSDGLDAWFYVDIEKKKQIHFNYIIKSNKVFDLTDYGAVLDSGYGIDPPEHLVKKYENM